MKLSTAQIKSSSLLNYAFFIFLLLMVTCLTVRAQSSHSSGGSQRISVLSGYSQSHLDNLEDDDYQLVPLVWRFSYDGDYLLRKIGLNVPGRWQMNIEPYFAQVISPDNRQEFGCGFMLRGYLFSLNLPKQISFFLEGGVGPAVLTQDNKNQDTDFNFIDQIGGGIEITLSEQCSLEITDRFRHVSNAGLGNDNGGIDGNVFLVGMTWRY